MSAIELIIDGKPKVQAFLTVSPDDFQYHEGQAVDPAIVITQANISLYCLDHAHQRAIFVETAPDFSVVDAPFYFVAQYEGAQRLIAVSYDRLHELALANPVDLSKVILIYSTGRCGSTLMSRVFDQSPEVVGFSEPDVFTQLLILRASGQADDQLVTRLLFDSLTIMAANTRYTGKSFWSFKFRSYVTSLSDLLYQAAPQAKVIYLYRGAQAWAASFARAFGASDEGIAQAVPIFRWQIPLVNDYVNTHSQPISYPDYLARMWVSCMQAALELVTRGVQPFVAHYDDIKAAPQAMVTAMCAYCGIRLPEADQLRRTLATDSQAGTVADKAETERKAARVLTRDEMAELERVVQSFAPTISADMTLTGTFKVLPEIQ